MPNNGSKSNNINRMLVEMENDVSNFGETQKRSFLIDIIQMTRRLRKELWDEFELKEKRSLMDISSKGIINNL